MHLPRAAALPAVAALAVAVVAAAAAPAGATRAAAPTAVRVTYRGFPNPEIPHYEVSGVLPVVPALPKANAGLLASFTSYERAYRAQAVAEEKAVPSPASFRGLFSVDGSVTAASATVVSTLLTTERLFPGGNDGEGYFSYTALAGDRQVHLGDVIAGAPALRSLATTARTLILRHYPCVAAANSGALGSIAGTGFSPTVDHFRNFAVLKAGLLFGFDQGQFADEACGAVTQLVPWSALTLTAVGRGLEASAVAPVHQGRYYPGA